MPGLLSVGVKAELWVLHLLTQPRTAKVSFLTYCIKICFIPGLVNQPKTPTSASSSLIKHHLIALQPCCQFLWRKCGSG